MKKGLIVIGVLLIILGFAITFLLIELIKLFGGFNLGFAIM